MVENGRRQKPYNNAYYRFDSAFPIIRAYPRNGYEGEGFSGFIR